MMVYISHSRQNSSAAFLLRDALQKRGLEPWLDLVDVTPGTDWNQGVADAIRKADGFVFLLGPSGPEDRGQNYEWQQILENQYDADRVKAMIPVVVGEVEMPGFLKTRRILSAPPADFEAVADEVVKGLKSPAETIDQEKIEKGREERVRSMKRLRDYAQELEKKEDARRRLSGLE